MNLLAFDTSTDRLSIAVSRGGARDVSHGTARVWQHTGGGGAQASGALIPAIQALMGQADLRFDGLDAIAFGKGPGSFTGLRTACSVAQGLAFGAGVPVLPVDTLLAVAEEARHQLSHTGPLGVIAVLDARMDEVYAACYVWDGSCWKQFGDYALTRPETLLQALGDAAPGVLEQRHGWLIAGNAAAAHGARLPVMASAPVHALPSAAAMLRLAPQLLASGHAVPADQALPTYIRDKVAKTTRERQTEKYLQSAS